MENKEELGYFGKFKDFKTRFYNYCIEEEIARKDFINGMTVYREDITLIPVIARGGVLVGYTVDGVLYNYPKFIENYKQFKEFIKEYGLESKS